MRVTRRPRECYAQKAFWKPLWTMNNTDLCVCIPPILLRVSDVHAHAFLQHSFSLTFQLQQLLSLSLSFHVPRGPELFSLTQTPYKFFQFALLLRYWLRLLYFLLQLPQCFFLLHS